MSEDILINVIILLGAAVFVVAILRHLSLSPVLGYLIAGAAIGDHGFKIVTYDQTRLLGELGVVFLLFAIGLELTFERLKSMRRYVFGLGTLQVVTTAIVIAASVVLINGDNSAAIIIGGGLALSSTALVMQVIEENRSQSAQIGRISLSILLLQDLAVVPLLVIVPLLSASNEGSSLSAALGFALLKAVIALSGIFLIGRTLLRPLFNFIAATKDANHELSIGVTLLIVLSAAWATEYFGLSLALGAFVAGVLVAETDFRLQAEESIYPFKSLLLGLFFMTVGMNIDAIEIYNQISEIITLTIVLIIVKTSIITAFCILFGFNKGVSFYAGLLLSQGGEFAFILFGLGKETGILEKNTANILLLVVTCTMALTPLLAMFGRKVAETLEKNSGKSPLNKIELGARDLTGHTIIAGFGSVGKMVAKVLDAEGLNYIVLDLNDERIKEENTNGVPIFKGDVSQLDTLKAVGIERSSAVLLTMKNQITIKKAARLISEHFPDREIVARLKSLKQAREFYDMGVTRILPENYEAGLQIGSIALKIGGISENEINRVKIQFRAGNYIVAKRNDILPEAEEND